MPEISLLFVIVDSGDIIIIELLLDIIYAIYFINKRLECELTYVIILILSIISITITTLITLNFLLFPNTPFITLTLLLLLHLHLIHPKLILPQQTFIINTITNLSSIIYITFHHNTLKPHLKITIPTNTKNNQTKSLQ